MPTAAASGTFPIAGELEVNRLGFGAMRLTGPGITGPPADVDNARAVLRRAVELGVNHIDTADAYGPDVSEELIAEALHPYPDDLVIATKGGLVRTGERGEWPKDGRPEHLREACEGSLRRLRVDAHRRLLPASPRPRGPLRGVRRRAEGAQGRGQDPPRRGLERERGAAGDRPRHRRHRPRPEPVQPHRPPLAGRARHLRGGGDRVRPVGAARRGRARPGRAGRGDRAQPRRDPAADRPRVAAAHVAGDAADPGDVVARAPRGERRGGGDRARRAS